MHLEASTLKAYATTLKAEATTLKASRGNHPEGQCHHFEATTQKTMSPQPRADQLKPTP
jgi:hypothetical protein